MPLKSLTKILLLPGILLAFTSCVKDVDLNQNDDFRVGPDIAIDLADFKFTSAFFLDTADLPVTIRKDTLDLQMLDPDLVNELDSVQFYFAYQNTFQRSFDNKYVFYSDTFEALHEIPNLRVEPGQENNPNIQDTTVVVKGETMDRIKDAAYLEITLSIGDEDAPANGELTANIIAIYNFREFDL